MNGIDELRLIAQSTLSPYNAVIPGHDGSPDELQKFMKMPELISLSNLRIA
jgi:hypothetical protein